jgi:hypothetical protein
MFSISKTLLRLEKTYNMNKKLAITLGIVGGIAAVGLLIYHFSRQDSNDEKGEIAPDDLVKVRKPDSVATTAPKPDEVTTPAISIPEPSIEAIKEQQVVTTQNQNVVPEMVSEEPEQVTPHEAKPALIQEERSFTPEVKIEEPRIIGDDFPLRMGSEGQRVERLQVFLLRNFGRVKVNGVFDQETEDQLKKRLNKTTLDERTYNHYKMEKHILEQPYAR